MTRVTVRDNQLRLPREAREALGLAAEDEVEVEVLDDAVLLRRSEAGRQARGRERMRRARSSVRPSPDLAELSAEECEARIAELIEADRRDDKRHA